MEKKIFAEHRSLMGTSEIDSKYKYVKLARGLPTFGVHFFLVKVGYFSLNFFTYFESCTASYVSEALLIFVNLVDFAFLLKLLAQEK